MRRPCKTELRTSTRIEAHARPSPRHCHTPILVISRSHLNVVVAGEAPSFVTEIFVTMVVDTVHETLADEDYANPAPPTMTSPCSPLPFKRLPLHLPIGKHRFRVSQIFCSHPLLLLCKFVASYSDSLWTGTSGTRTVAVSDDEEGCA